MSNTSSNKNKMLSQLRDDGLQASMLEIYNEEVKDLLGKGAPAGKKHQISHDDKGVTSVSFVENVDCKRPEKVKELLAKGTRMRSVGEQLSINLPPPCSSFIKRAEPTCILRLESQIGLPSPHHFTCES